MDVAPILYNEFPLFLRRYFPYKVQNITECRFHLPESGWRERVWWLYLLQ